MNVDNHRDTARRGAVRNVGQTHRFAPTDVDYRGAVRNDEQPHNGQPHRGQTHRFAPTDVDYRGAVQNVGQTHRGQTHRFAPTDVGCRGAVLITAAFFVLATLYNIITPIFEAPDEPEHYRYIHHIATTRTFPIVDVNDLPPGAEIYQQPLYYMLAAIPTALVLPPGDVYDLPRNPHAILGKPAAFANKNVIYHSNAERFPYRGTTLAVHTIRLLSTIMGTLTVWLTYLTARAIFPRRRWLTWGALCLVAFNPQFIYISGAISNDNAVVVACAAVVYLLIRAVAPHPNPLPEGEREHAPLFPSGSTPPSRLRAGVGGGGRFPAKFIIALGIILGLALLSKTTAFALIPLIALALMIVAWRERKLAWLPVWGGAVAVLAAVVAGWWYWRNWQLYGDPMAMNLARAIFHAHVHPPGAVQLISEIRDAEISFWAVFGSMNITVAEWYYVFVKTFTRLGTLGVVVAAVRHLRKCFTAQFRARCWQLAILAIWISLNAVALVRLMLMFRTALQGRMMFPALPAIAILLFWGILELVRIPHPPAPSPFHGEGEKSRSGAISPHREGEKPRPAATPPLYREAVKPHSIAPSLRSGEGVGGEVFSPIVTILIGAVMFITALIFPFQYIAPVYARPAPLSAAEVATIPHRLDVNFANRARLIGYDLSYAGEQLHSGDTVYLTLYWEARREMETSYSVFVHLLDEYDLIVAQTDSAPGRGNYPTQAWRAGEVIADEHRIVIPETAFTLFEGHFAVGLYDFDTGTRLPVVDEGTDHARFGSVSVARRDSALGGVAVAGNFAGRIMLVGYDMDTRRAAPGETVTLTLYWRATAPLETDYTVFTHIIGERDHIAGQHDSPPQEGAAPTSAWQPGEIIRDEHHITINSDAPAGVYDVEVGLYDAATRQRLPVVDDRGQYAETRMFLGKVRIVNPTKRANT